MSSVRKLMRFVKPYRTWVIIAPILMLLEVVMDLMQPRLMERIIDDGIAQGNATAVLQIGLTMIGLSIVGAFGGMSNGVFAVKAVQGFGADLRQALFQKVQALSFGNLDELETGQLITRLTNDVTQVQEAMLTMLRILIRAPLLLVGGLVMAIVTSPRLVWLPLALVPVLLLVIVWVIRTATPMFSIVQKWLDKLNGVMQENLAGARVVKAFVRGQHEEERFGGVNIKLVDQTIHVARVTAVLMPFMMIVMNLGVVGVLWYGGREVVAGNMQLGQIVAFINYLQLILFSLLMVSMLIVQVSRAQASADRIQEVLESVPVVQTRPDALQEFHPQGRVAFHHVSFRYNGNEQDNVLQDVSFVANPGDLVALVGTTGSGKSSLVSLIPRFYDVTSGRVTIDDVDVRDIDEKALRRNIGIALQETVLFSGTIRDNIRYGRPDASDEEVETAARMAQAHDFITSFPEGYDTQVGQRGVNLSGGQKQRMAVARALLLRPAVLILDDSTSSVDVETEAIIQGNLRAFMAGRTSFVIAQRISSVMGADKILVLENGRIAAEGTHRELMTSSPIYREICESQLGSVDGEVAHG
ncbi:MAG: ABC transporter ATP-binding protein [Anaerolineae bacterium]